MGGPKSTLREQLRDAASSADSSWSPDGSRASQLSGIDVRSCKTPGGPTGAGQVTVTFRGTGVPTSVTLDGPPFANTVVGDCVIAKFRAVRIGQFDGGTVAIHKSFIIN